MAKGYRTWSDSYEAAPNFPGPGGYINNTSRDEFLTEAEQKEHNLRNIEGIKRESANIPEHISKFSGNLRGGTGAGKIDYNQEAPGRVTMGGRGGSGPKEGEPRFMYDMDAWDEWAVGALQGDLTPEERAELKRRTQEHYRNRQRNRAGDSGDFIADPNWEETYSNESAIRSAEDWLYDKRRGEMLQKQYRPSLRERTGATGSRPVSQPTSKGTGSGKVDYGEKYAPGKVTRGR